MATLNIRIADEIKNQLDELVSSRGTKLSKSMVNL